MVVSGGSGGYRVDSRLPALARAAAVAIGEPPPRGGGGGLLRLWGSGVLVAPDWVATVGHLFVSEEGERGTGKDEEIGVLVEGRLVRARLAYLEAERVSARAGAPGLGRDLALLHLLGRPASRPADGVRPPRGRRSDPAPGIGPEVPPVAWLGSRDPVLSESAHVFGHQEEVGADGARRIQDTDTACRASGIEGPYVVVTGATLLRPGYSGGPVVDLDRGEVVGLLKSRWGTETGKVIPLEELHWLGPEHHRDGAPDLGPRPWRTLLREHDLWHVAYQDASRRIRPSWTDERARLPWAARAKWGPREQMAELARLARLPLPDPPDLVGRRVRPASGRSAEDWPRPLDSWRDGSVRLRDDPVDHLRYLADVVKEVQLAERRAERPDNPAVTELADWVLERRRELAFEEQLEVAPTERLPLSVLVELGTLIGYEGQGQHYHWSISHGFGEGEWQQVRLVDDAERLTLDEALGQVRDRLGGVLAAADGYGAPTRLEVAVPLHRFLPAAHRWLAVDGTRGAEREVVVRHSERRGDADPRWLTRWNHVVSAPRLGARAVLELADLDRVGEREVPVLCGHGPTDGGELTAALLALGHPLTLWRSGAETTECGPACADFRTHADAWLRGHGAKELPRQLRELRHGIEAGRDAAHHGWARELILLYDDPGNPLP